MRRLVGVASLVVVAVACAKAPTERVYQAVPVETRDIVVSAQAAGVIQPDTLVEVKSKASGEILNIKVQTGDRVARGALLIQVDERTPTNALAQSEADLEVAKARLQNATAQKNRSEALYQAQAITETEYETAQLDYANAKAAVVTAQVAVENDKIRLEDTDVRAPISGTVIEKNVERGTVISSPTAAVGGGTVLLKMADLTLVQVRTLVDETDIGKIKVGLPATVTVQAYPNRPFEGEVFKIEPQAVTEQNLTMFPVLVRIRNRDDLLRPGMNADVEIHIGERTGVLAVPNAALRTQRDVASAAALVGLAPDAVQQQLAQTRPADSTRRASLGGTTPDSQAAAPAANTITFQGRTVTLPEGVTRQQVEALFQKMRDGQRPSTDEMAILQKIRQALGGGGRAGGGRRAPTEYQFGGRYVVFVVRDGQPQAVNIRTGLTDLDYSEVVDGLTATDSVLVLPSASLLQSMQSFQERINRVTGGGGIPGVRSNSSSSGRR